MIKSLTTDIKAFFDKKKKVIHAVKNYYSGNLRYFPYSSADIRETKSWLMTSGQIHQKELLIERLTMLETMISKHH